MTTGRAKRPRVGLFVTCLVDLMRPSVGFAAVRLLEAAGCEVGVPAAQTCCGQPAYNGGDRSQRARRWRRRRSRRSTGFDYVVAPSGSCAAMLKLHYPRLFAGDDGGRSARPGLRRAGARAHLLPGRRARPRGRARDFRRPRRLPRRLLGPARARHQRVSRARCWRPMAGVELVEMRRCAGMLRLRRSFLGQISRHLRRDRRAKDGGRSPPLRRHSWWSGELGCLMHLRRQAQARWLADRLPPRRRGAGGRDEPSPPSPGGTSMRGSAS